MERAMKPQELQSLFLSRCHGLEASIDPDIVRDYAQDWTRFHLPSAAGVVFPDHARQVMALVGLARDLKLSLVPSGGRTGLSGGAVAANGEWVVSMERMREIMDFDPVGRLLRVQAGVVTASVQAYAEQKGLYYPVSFGAEGSAQIGGTIATNAGGIRVLRHGLTRDRVAGLKVVDGRGRLLNLNRGLVKNASGYDLRHLMIGSEGTLGLIVEATLRLTVPPLPSRVLLLALPSIHEIPVVLQRLQSELELSACEFFSSAAMQLVCKHLQLPPPLACEAAYFVLLEFDTPAVSVAERENTCMQVLEECLGQGSVIDGVLSQSGSQNRQLWRYRECISEAAAPHTPYKNDLSVRLSRLPDYLEALDHLVARELPDFQVLWYGHVGDGNLHLNILKPGGLDTADFESSCAHANEKIYELTARFGGSVSAEHGIGLLKQPFLPYCRSADEIDLMRGIKAVFDPDGILNPGKIL